MSRNFAIYLFNANKVDLFRLQLKQRASPC
jgi:hypothetical protein